MTRVLHEDLRAIKFCNRGSREFFERHGLDWSEFLRHGVDAQVLLDLDDHMALQVVEQARKREAQGDVVPERQ